jgi:site-specific DNA-methyltransferase (adenine-specific)
MAELTLHNGDCLEIMKAIPDKSVDLIICDLPYGCLQGGCPKGREGTNGAFAGGCAWDIKIDLDAFWKQVKRIRKSDHSPTIHFCTTKFGYEIIKSNPDEFRYDLVWDKQRGVSFLSANKMPMRSHEMIYVFSKAGAFYNRVDISGNFIQSSGGRDKSAKPSAHYGSVKETETKNEGKRCVLSVINQPEIKNTIQGSIYNCGDLKRTNPIVRVLNKDTDTRCVTSVIKQSGGLKKGNHPTEKPEALYRFLIERYCPTNGTVLDPTFGSGNSVFTAFAMGRNAIGIEKDEKFFEKAETRLNALP